MLDIRAIREDAQGVLSRLRRRDPTLDLDDVLRADERRRELIRRVEDLRRERNEGSQAVAALQAEGRRSDAQARIEELRSVSAELKTLEEELTSVESSLHDALLRLPALPSDDVPDGAADEKLVLRTWGSPAEMPFTPLHHVILGKQLDLLDLERAARIAGSRFPLYTGLGARLEMALLQWMLELHVREHGYRAVLPPILANREAFLVSGQLPKFEEDLYKCAEEDLYLNPTSESLLVNLHRGEILEAALLPLRYVAYTPCFRREAGTYGEESRGLIRMHQFNKVELFQYCVPEDSDARLEEIVGQAERVLQLLGLCYRVTLLTVQDLAQQSTKTVDLEVWLPGQGRYYEVSSCSNCGDYQARRGDIRYRDPADGAVHHVHTLNGSGLATSRLFAAILEQNQDEHGVVRLPQVLAERLGVEVLR